MEIFAPGMAFKGLVGAFQIEGEKRNELSYPVLYAACYSADLLGRYAIG